MRVCYGLCGFGACAAPRPGSRKAARNQPTNGIGKLVRQRLNVGSNDLKSAATALEHNAIVVTRNLRDFGRVEGLVCEDWAR